jgi:hypothetical protein
MKHQSILDWLVPFTGLAALIAAGVGLLWHDGEPFTFISLHGQQVEMYGRGLHRYDTLLAGAAFRGTGIVTLFVMLPLLGAAYWLARRGSLRGSFLLAGALSYFFYNGASLAFSAAFNQLFFVYVIYLGASFYAFLLVMTGVDLRALLGRVSQRVPHRGIAAFLFVGGLVPLALWGGEVAAAQAQGQVPELLGSYTTLYTHAFDMAIIVPAAFTAAVLVLRRAPLGYLLAAVLLVLLAAIGLVVIGQTIMQVEAGFTYTTGQLIGFVASWVVLSAIAMALGAALFRGLPRSASRKPARARPH